MDWEIVEEVVSSTNDLSEHEFVKDHATGSILGGGAALAAGIALGITNLPLAVPLLIAGGAFGGAAGEKGVKATGKAVTGFFNEVTKNAELLGAEVTKKIDDIKDFFKNEEDFLFRGVERLKLNDYKGAIEDFSKVIDINPKHTDAYFFRGCVHSDRRNYRAAIEDYTKVIKLDTNYTEAYINRGHVYASSGNDIKAIADYSHVIIHEPENPSNLDIHIKRGSLFLKLKEYGKSLEDYSQAIKINPKTFEAYFMKGCINMELKKYNDAIIDFTEAIKIRPKNTDSYFYRVEAYIALSNEKAALDDLTRVIKFTRGYKEALLKRAKLYFELKDYNQAIIDYTTVIRKDINCFDAYYMIACANNRKGDTNVALENLNELVKINPNYSDAYISRGSIYQKNKKYKQAIYEFKIAIEILSKELKLDKVQQLQKEIIEIQQIQNNQWWNIKIF